MFYLLFSIEITLLCMYFHKQFIINHVVSKFFAFPEFEGSLLWLEKNLRSLCFMRYLILLDLQCMNGRFLDLITQFEV